MSKYNPKTVLRQTSNSLLRELFRTCSSVPDLPWHLLGEREIQPIFEAMQTLPERERRRLDALLEEYQLPLPGSALVAGVKFRVHFSDRRWPRTIELRAPNRAKIVWDTYGRRIAHWLRRRNLVRHLLEKAA